MTKKSASDVVGLEFDWLGVDAEDAVGFFSTAGGGYAPEEFLDDTDAYDRAIEAILGLPMSTSAVCTRTLRPDLQDTWRMMAERGIFAFDSDPDGGPYQLVATPTVPIQFGALPDTVAEVAQRIRCPQLRFSALNAVSADLLKRK
ncbi:MAG TPA: hypothetical protein VEU33_48945 [Archangium sp.]|nr:hypothetical protein [Archangium sp.]